MSELTARRFGKLPKWAQREIERLTRNVEFWKDKLRLAKAGETRMWLGLGITDEDSVHIPDDSPLIIYLGDDPKEDRWNERLVLSIDRNSSGKRVLRIQGGDAVYVRPGASNSICVGVAENGLI